MTNVEASRSATGGPAAIRGFRLQVLYALDLLTSGVQRARLEGVEDIDVLGPEDELVEVLQVKAHGAPLALSTLKSRSGDTSFFERMRDLVARHRDIRGSIVSFGAVGPELRGALGGDQVHRRAVADKLRDDYKIDGADDLLSRAMVREENEGRLYARLSERLQAMCPAASAETTIHLLGSWLLLCAEQRAVVTTAHVAQRLEGAGEFAANCRAYAEEWFRTIKPLSTSDPGPAGALAEEFYQGIAARPDHIAAGVDVRRHQLLGAIDKAFRSARVVVLHGPSGEGKSALLFRYAEDYAKGSLRYLVDVDADLARTQSIAAALAAFAEHASADILLLLDVRPRNRHWPRIVEALASAPQVRIIVGAREEDWREAHELSYRVRLEDVAVRLDESEAREVFEDLRRTRSPATFVSFMDAWDAFGGAGPMLEFVHLVTRQQSLKARLREQIQHLFDDLEENEIELVRRAACGTGYGGRVSLAGLAGGVSLSSTRAIRLVERLEEEYFVRRAAGGAWIEPVHPIRSRILCELVFDPAFAPLSAGMVHTAALVHDDDLEGFVFESFLLGNPPPELVAAEAVRLVDARPTLSWRSCIGVVRALLWLDLSAYVDDARRYIEIAKVVLPGAWRFLLPWDFAPGWSQDTSAALTEVRRKILESNPLWQEAAETVASQVPTLTYHRLLPFLRRDWSTAPPPTSIADWMALCEIAFWHRTVGVEAAGPMSVIDPEMEVPNELPLQAQAELVGFPEWLGRTAWSSVARRTIDRYRIVWISDAEDALRVTFLLGVREGRELLERGDGALNARAVAVSSLLRTLIPGRRGYGCVGVAWPRQLLPHNPVEKSAIKSHQLSSRWGRRVLPVIMQMIERPDLPGTWKEHADSVAAMRSGFVEALQMLLSRCAIDPRWDGTWTENESGRRSRAWEERPPEIPACARDPWCVGSLEWKEDAEDALTWFSARYSAYIKTLRSFHSMASTLAGALGGRGDPGTLDWAELLRLAIACWSELPKLHAIDRAPFRPWWPDEDVDRLEQMERTFLAEAIALVGARRNGDLVRPHEAFVAAMRKVDELVEQVAADVSAGVCPAHVALPRGGAERAPAIIVIIQDPTDIDGQAAEIKRLVWARLRAEHHDLHVELQTFASTIDLIVALRGSALAAYSFPSIFALTDREDAFMSVPSRAVEEYDLVGCSLARIEPLAEIARPFESLIMTSMACVDLLQSWRPTWNQPLADMCFEELLEDLRPSIAQLYQAAEAATAIRPDPVEARDRVRRACEAAQRAKFEDLVEVLEEIHASMFSWSTAMLIERALAEPAP